ncbi:MAG: SBBP repeat-containing protein, partial [Limisphaerales bacterium]
YDYAVLKYAPDGTQVWATRYAAPAGGTNTVAALALDQVGNAYVTGTGGTVKFSSGGALAWTAPYAGTSLAADTNENV